MKPRSIVIAATLIVLFAAASLSWGAPAVRVQIPFEFRVGNAVLPAGQYHIVSTDVPNQFLIRQADGQSLMYALSVQTGKNAPADAEQCTLAFHQYGDRYFLQTLAVPGYPVSQFHMSKAEKEMIARATEQRARTLVAELIRK